MNWRNDCRFYVMHPREIGMLRLFMYMAFDIYVA